MPGADGLEPAIHLRPDLVRHPAVEPGHVRVVEGAPELSRSPGRPPAGDREAAGRFVALAERVERGLDRVGPRAWLALWVRRDERRAGRARGRRELDVLEVARDRGTQDDGADAERRERRAELARRPACERPAPKGSRGCDRAARRTERSPSRSKARRARPPAPPRRGSRRRGARSVSVAGPGRHSSPTRFATGAASARNSSGNRSTRTRLVGSDSPGRRSMSRACSDCASPSSSLPTAFAGSWITRSSSDANEAPHVESSGLAKPAQNSAKPGSRSAIVTTT